MLKLTIAVAFVASSLILSGQAAPPSEVLGVGNFIHVVADLEKSIEFYRDTIGLELTGAPGPHVFSANAVVSSLYDAPGAQSRVASLRIPGSEMAVEMVEFQSLNAKPVRPRLQDPGAITLILTVRDLDAAKMRLKNADVVNNGGGSREVTVRDPDGILVRLTQRDPAPATTAPASANVIGAGFGVTVADLDRSVRFFRETLRFQGESNSSTATMRRSTLLVPGSMFPLELTEFKSTDAKPAHSAIHDPGSSVLRLRVGNFDAVVNGLKAAGVPIVSSGGEVVNLGRNRAVIFREADNLFLQILEAPPAQQKK